MTDKLQKMLAQYRRGVEELFSTSLTGIYVTGSIVLKGFHEGKSDVDCTVLLEDAPTPKQLAALQKIHRCLQKQYRDMPLECQYILRREIGKTERAAAPFYAYHDGKLSLGKFNANAVTWFTLARYGLTLSGVAATELNNPVSPEDLRAYVHENVATYWKSWWGRAKKPFSRMSAFALTDRAVEWGVCGISRMYFTLKESDIASKDSAAEYALLHLPAWTHPIVNEALRIRRGEGGARYASRFRRKKDMLQYLLYMIELCASLPKSCFGKSRTSGMT